MSNTFRRAVAFDFDGTLTRGDTSKWLVAALVCARPQRACSVAAILLRVFLGRISPQEAKTSAVASLVKHRSEAAVQKAVSRFAWLVRKKLRPEVVTRLNGYLEEGDLTIIATGSPSFAVRGALPDDRLHVIGTEFEVVRGRYTGGCPADCYGEEKARRIRAFLESHGLASLKCAYTDHHSDLPMLLLAERKVLVHPDMLTRQLLGNAQYTLIE
jgi:phosphatidylglycerophosphatase C